MSQKRVAAKMIVDLDILITEVQSRPLLWNPADSNHSNRQAIRDAWEEVANALFSNYEEMTDIAKEDVLKDLRTRWKSTRDYFMKAHRTYEASGSSPSKKAKIPYEKQLSFLISTRKTRKTTGNYTSSTQVDNDQPPATLSKNQPSTSVQDSSETLQHESEVLVRVESVAAEAPTIALEPPVATPQSQPVTRRRGRRTLRMMDKQLEVEGEALSFIRRVEGNDECDHFGYTLASRVRAMATPTRENFMAYCLAASTIFDAGRQLPPVEKMIRDLRISSGERTPSPRGVAQGTQTKTNHYATSQQNFTPAPAGYPQYHLPRNVTPTNPPGPAHMEHHEVYGASSYYPN